MLSMVQFQRGVLTNLHNLANPLVVIDLVFGGEFEVKKKVKSMAHDRMGLMVGFSASQFESSNLGPQQTVSIEGLQFYFFRDGQAGGDVFGKIDMTTKNIVDLPTVSRSNLTQSSYSLTRLELLDHRRCPYSLPVQLQKGKVLSDRTRQQRGQKDCPGLAE